MPTQIIGLVGHIGAGKGMLASILVEKHHAEVIRFSTILRKIIQVLDLPETRDNLINASESLRKTFGEDVLSHAIASAALSSSAPMVVVDGIRRLDDISGLIERPEFKLVHVVADPKIRYDRLIHRGENSEETSMTWEDFLRTEQRSTEVSIDEVANRADETITNNGTREELETYANHLLSN